MPRPVRPARRSRFTVHTPEAALRRASTTATLDRAQILALLLDADHTGTTCLAVDDARARRRPASGLDHRRASPVTTSASPRSLPRRRAQAAAREMADIDRFDALALASAGVASSSSTGSSSANTQRSDSASWSARRGTGAALIPNGSGDHPFPPAGRRSHGDRRRRSVGVRRKLAAQPANGAHGSAPRSHRPRPLPRAGDPRGCRSGPLERAAGMPRPAANA